MLTENINIMTISEFVKESSVGATGRCGAFVGRCGSSVDTSERLPAND